MKADYHHLGRVYFPELDLNNFSEEAKKQIEADIEADFKEGYEGIKRLPRNSRFGVYIAYVYYLALFKKIRNMPSGHVLRKRIRIPNGYKFTLLLYSFFRHRLNII